VSKRLWRSTKGGPNLGTVFASLLLFMSVVVSLGAGILAGYGVVNAILFAFRPRVQQPEPATVLVARAAAGGAD
jgi:hypothetical protein